MFDYLSDHLEKPKIVLLNSVINEKILTAKIGFFSMGIKKHKAFDLIDKRGILVCQIRLPLAGYRLPKDIALDLTGEKFEVLTEYYA